MREIYIVKQEWNYYGDAGNNITICANEEAVTRIFNEKKSESVKIFKGEANPDKIEDESDGNWYYRIYERDNYCECYEEVSVEKKEIVY